MAVGGLTEEGGRERGKREEGGREDGRREGGREGGREDGRREKGGRGKNIHYVYLQHQMRGALPIIIHVLLELLSVRSCDSHMTYF